ncbi:protein-ribulosamine 3-kinase, chloroplastic-like isoform X2 [Musa acuminata AAA Group]|uniref:protein-ribulosamine 3-kinase, chloroplastic-like isoform X2 n=1 Tax=Musa acuminata AAA Group TaxID=214697 RepID=UPI0031E40683
MVHVGAPLSAPFSLGASSPRARRRASLLPKLTRRRSIMASMGDDPIREWILTEGKATQITRISPIGGGCINHASRYDTDSGSFFVKTNRIGPSMFEAESLGLSAMYATQSIRVPMPYKVGPLPTGGSFIIMEFIEFGPSRGSQSVLGRKLAEMHQAGKSSKGFGFDIDNTIGSTPQINSWSSDWIDFFSEHRLGYQLKLALDQYGDSAIYEKGQRLMKNLQPLFEGVVIEPCLLHGDLWSGNISSDKNGDPVILDPACYYGHTEAEFGMSWCAGFGGAFYSSYFELQISTNNYHIRCYKGGLKSNIHLCWSFLHVSSLLSEMHEMLSYLMVMPTDGIFLLLLVKYLSQRTEI